MDIDVIRVALDALETYVGVNEQWVLTARKGIETEFENCARGLAAMTERAKTAEAALLDLVDMPFEEDGDGVPAVVKRVNIKGKHAATIRAAREAQGKKEQG